MKTKYKHIEFKVKGYDRNNTCVTMIYDCINYSDEILGYVEFYVPWKQYCYFDTCEGIYSKQCLLDIVNFVGQLNSTIKSKV